MKTLLLSAALLLSQPVFAHHYEWHRPHEHHCHRCGVVQSVMAMTVPSTVWGYMGPMQTGQYVTVYRVSVTMMDGSLRFVDYNYFPGLVVGTPVIFQGGQIFRR